MTEEEAKAVIEIILMAKHGGWWYGITPFDLLNEFSRKFPQFSKLVELAEEEAEQRHKEEIQKQMERLKAKREYQREYRRTHKKGVKQ